jgi:putative transposase
MRCVKRQTVPLNVGKESALQDLCKAYAREKQYWLSVLQSNRQFAKLLRGEIPDFELELSSRKQITSYVRRLVKKLKGKAPLVKKRRHIKFDANCYDVFAHQGRQYLTLMSLERGKRIILPLEGKSSITGNIALVLNEENVEIHISYELKTKLKTSGISEAIDLGYTEVITDTENKRYGKQFSKLLTKTSDALDQKMQKRNRLHALYKHKKSRHILKYNLGRQKFVRTQRKAKAALKDEINQAINELVRTKQVSLLITENLSHLFTYNKPKKVNRRLSFWLKGEIQNRIAFKALAEGFCHEQVNPAYGSQVCPLCDFVDSKNRIRDKFKCLHCGHEDASDRVAAMNYARRYGDANITLYTPYSEVKTILLDRFHRRLETEKSVTVPGRTLETAAEMNPPSSVEINCHSRERLILLNRAVTQRAKQNEYV